MRNQHLQTDTYPALQRALIWLAVHNSTTEQSCTDAVAEPMEVCCPPVRPRAKAPYQASCSQDHDKLAGTSHGTQVSTRAADGQMP